MLPAKDGFIPIFDGQPSSRKRITFIFLRCLSLQKRQPEAVLNLIGSLQARRRGLRLEEGTIIFTSTRASRFPELLHHSSSEARPDLVQPSPSQEIIAMQGHQGGYVPMRVDLFGRNTLRQGGFVGHASCR